MWLLIREASAARNLDALLPLLAEYGPRRIAFCTDDREPEHIADDGHVNSMVRDAVAARDPAGGRARCATSARPPGTDCRTSARSRRATRPTCCSCPTSSGSCPSLVLKDGPAGRRDPARAGAGLGAADRADRRARARDLPRSRGAAGATRVIGLVPGQIVTESLVERADRARRRGGRRPGARPGEDRGDRAPSRAPAGSGSDSFAASGSSAGRSRRPSRTTHTTSSCVGDERRGDGVRGAPAREPGRRHRRRRGLEACARAAAAGGGPALATSRSRRWSRRAGRCRRGARARLHDRGAVPAASVPGAVGDPEPEDHRPRAGRRRPVRARAAGAPDDPVERLDRHDGRRRHRARARLAADRGRPDRGARPRRPAGLFGHGRADSRAHSPTLGGERTTRHPPRSWRRRNGLRRKPSFATKE